METALEGRMAKPRYFPEGPGPFGLSARSSNCMINSGFDWRNKSQDDQLRIAKDFCAFIFERPNANSKVQRWESLPNFGKVCADELNQLARVHAPDRLDDESAPHQSFSAKDIHAKVLAEIDRIVSQQVKRIAPKEYNIERMIDSHIADIVQTHTYRVTEGYRKNVIEAKIEALVDADLREHLSKKRIQEWIDQAIHAKVTEAIGALEQSIFERVMRAKFVQPKTRYIKEFHEMMSDAITEAYRKE